MYGRWIAGICVSMLLLTSGLAAPLSATTLIRAGLEELVVNNEIVVMGEVVDIFSYWNKDATFILTDVRVRPLETIKGVTPKTDLIVTLMGGTVDETTTLILGGPELEIGKPYVFFLNRENLPGVENAVTVRDHCQGVFDLIDDGDGLKAISQANEFALLPDAHGLYKAAGDIEGFKLDDMFQSIRDLAAHGAPRR